LTEGPLDRYLTRLPLPRTAREVAGLPNLADVFELTPDAAVVAFLENAVRVSEKLAYDDT
jgi:hypothetical protein